MICLQGLGASSLDSFRIETKAPTEKVKSTSAVPLARELKKALALLFEYRNLSNKTADMIIKNRILFEFLTVI